MTQPRFGYRLFVATIAIVLSLVALGHAGRVLTPPNINGQAITPANYGASIHLGLQTNNTGFGDNLNELNGLCVADDGTYLYIGLTGNLQNNGNRIYIILDTVAGSGVANLADPVLTYNEFDQLAATAGAIALPNATALMTDFRADYGLVYKRSDNSLGLGNYLLSSGSFLGTVSPYTNGSEVGVDNNNTGGVAGTPVPGFTGTPSTVTTGFEFKIPLSSIGSPAVGTDIKIIAFITSFANPVGFSNQFLPGLPTTVANLGANPASFGASYVPLQYVVGTFSGWTNSVLDPGLNATINTNHGLNAGQLSRVNGTAYGAAANTFTSSQWSTGAVPAFTGPSHRIALSTLGYKDIVLSFAESRQLTGIREHAIWWSNDNGASFTLFNTFANPDNATVRQRTINLSTIDQIEDDTDVVLLINGYQTEAAAGTWLNTHINVAGALETTAPTVTSIVAQGANPTNAASVSFLVTFSEPVTGAAAANFSLATTGGQSGASISGVSGTGNTRTVTVNTVDNQTGTIRLDLSTLAPVIEDAVGNDMAATFTSGGTFNVDRLDPTVASIVRNSATPSNATSVSFTVTFSEPITGTGLANYTVATTGGQIGASHGAPVGSGDTYTVSVLTIDNATGTIRLDLSSTAPSITDALGNALTATFATGETYSIDRLDPVVSSITRANPNPTNASSVDFLVTFSENVTGVSGTNFDLVTTGGQGGASITGLGGTNATRTITVDTVDGATGTIRLDLDSATPTISDALGNPLSVTFSGGQTYSVDRQDPAVSTINVINERTIDITFDEAVTAANVPANYLASGAGLGTMTSNPDTAVFVSGLTYRLQWNAPKEMYGGTSITVTGSSSIADALGNSLGVLNAATDTSIGVRPSVSGVLAVAPNQVDVTFSEAMGGAGVVAPGTYVISGTGQGTLASNPTSVVFQSGSTYRLTWATGSQAFGGNVTITASSSATDLAANPLDIPNSGTHLGGGVPVELSAFSLE